MEKLFELIDNKEEEMIEELKQVVNIDSGSYSKKGIDQIISRYEEFYANLGFETEIKVNREQGNNLVAKREGELEGSWLFLGHVDTVFPAGTAAKRPFKLDEEGDRAYGPGVSDMKSGLVMLKTVLEALLSLDTKLPDVVVLLNGDEEIGSPASKNLIETAGREATACFVLEPGRQNGDMVIARKGTALYELVVRGQAAHAGSNHAQGISAVEELAHKILAVQKLTDYKRGITFNVGVIEGGKRSNIIADEARAEIDLRIAKLEQIDEAEEKLQEIADREYLPGTETVLNGGLNRPPMEEDQEAKKLFEVLAAVAKKLDVQLGTTVTGGASDGNFVSVLGVPTLDALGPVGGGNHSEDEYIELSSLNSRAKILAGGLQELARQKH